MLVTYLHWNDFHTWKINFLDESMNIKQGMKVIFLEISKSEKFAHYQCNKNYKMN